MNRPTEILLRCALLVSTAVIIACGESRPEPGPATNKVSKPIAVQKVQSEASEPVVSPNAGAAAKPGKSEPSVDEKEAEPVLPNRSQVVEPEEPDIIIPALEDNPSDLHTDIPLNSSEALPNWEHPEQPERAEDIDTASLLSPADLEAAAATSELIKQSLQVAVTYDPKDRFDPFQPLFSQRVETPVVTKSKREKRIPQTPLERLALSQLKVTAIIRSAAGNRALVEDSTGRGYVVQKGTYIGLNAGRVVEIDQTRIVIEEEIENIMGELTVKNAELKLQKPAGEL